MAKENGRVLTRDAILGAEDIQLQRLDIPEWNGTVLVRGLTADQRDAYENSYLIQKKDRIEIRREHMRARLVSLAVVDEAGATLFSESDVDAIGRKSAKAIDRIFDVAMKLSGLTESDMEELKGN